MKKLVSFLLIICIVPAFAFADGFGMTIPEFIRSYNNYSFDKQIEDISNGKVFGSGDTQYIRLKADEGVEIFLRYSENVDSELSGIIIMQKESSTDFEKLIAVATSATYVLSNNADIDISSAYYQHYQAVCETISYYGYCGKSAPVSAKGYTVEYQIDNGTRQIYIAPTDH